MKTMLVLGLAALLASPLALAKGSHSSHGSEVHVRAHVTKEGAYVPAHARTAPNTTKRDNWSAKGNVNPHTGKAGTKDPNT